MGKVISFTAWRAAQKKKTWKTKEEPFLFYINKVLLGRNDYPKTYSASDASTDLEQALVDALDEFSQSLGAKIAKPPKLSPTKTTPQTGPGRNSGTKTKPGEVGKSKKDEDASDDSDTGDLKLDKLDKGSGGGGNQIIKKSKPPPAFDNKTEFGDMELRQLVLSMPKNPDLVMKEESEKELKDDTMQWGAVRTSPAMNIDPTNVKEFERAPPGSLWLGFVRIGKRVGLGEDRLALIRISPTPGGDKFAVGSRELVAGQPWHSLWLDRKFDAKTDPKIKVWNGWSLDALKKDKTLKLSETGSFFGFFLIKAADGGANHYYNFRCATLNRFANAVYSDDVPDMPRSKMTSGQHHTILNLINAVRSGFDPDLHDLDHHFPGIPRKRAVLALDTASKRVPMSWAKVIVTLVQKQLKSR